MKMLSEGTLKELNYLLERAMAADNADMGNIQVFDARTDTLRIVVQKGFKRDFLEHFKVVKAFDSSACGRAIGIGSPVVINDVLLDIAFAPHRAIAKSAGFRSVKSVPVIAAGERFLGVISTHFKEPKWNWDLNSLTSLVERLAGLLQDTIEKGNR